MEALARDLERDSALEPNSGIRLRDAWCYLQWRGATAAARAIIDRYLYRSFRGVVTISELAGPPVPEKFDDITFHLATDADVSRLAEFGRYGGESALRALLREEGEWLFVARHGNRVIATCRCSRTVLAHSLMARIIRLEPGEVWGTDTYCAPHYRNRGIGRHVAAFADRFVASLGYRYLVGVVSVTNRAACWMHGRLGRQAAWHVSYNRLLFYERLRVSKGTADLLLRPAHLSPPLSGRFRPDF